MRGERFGSIARASMGSKNSPELARQLSKLGKVYHPIIFSIFFSALSGLLGHNHHRLEIDQVVVL